MPAPSLVYCPHPLLAAAGRRIVYEPFLQGESIGAYLDRAGVGLSPPVLLALNDRPVPREQWHATFPRPGDLITVRALVQGGGDSGGSNPIRTILSIALLVVAPQMGAWLLPANTALGTALVMVGGSLLVNALAPPPKPPKPGESAAASPTYALSGAANRARPFEPLPLVFGTHRIYPDLGAKPYTEFRGEDQYLYLVFNFGLSDLTLSDFRIGDTPLTDFQDYELQESGADGALTLFPANVDTIDGGALTAAAGWITKTSSTNATALAVDIQGVLFYSGNNGLETRRVDLEIEYRAVGSGTWLPFLDTPTHGNAMWAPNTYFANGRVIVPTVFNGFQYQMLHNPTISYNTGATEPVWPTVVGGFVADPTVQNPPVEGWADTGWTNIGAVSTSNVHLAHGSRAPLRVTYRRSVASGQYEVRVRRLTPDETDARAVSDLVWSALRTYQPDAATYSGQKRVALAIKASGQLQGTVDRFSALAAARVPVWNGTAWVTQATSNPAWHFLWFARGATIAGRRAFGALLPDTRIDIAAIQAFGAFCDSKALTFDAVIDRTLSCAEVLTLIARCGRGTPTWATGKLGAIWDAASQPIVAVFGMANIRRNTFKVQYLTGKIADEIVVNFVNPSLNWQQDTVRVTVPGVTNPVRPAVVELFGCASEVMAGKEANLLAAAQVYRRRQITWEADFEGMVVQRGDVVTLSHDLTSWGYSGRLVAGTATQLTLDRKVAFSGAGPWYIGVVFPNGYYHIFDVQAATGEQDVIALTEAWPTVDDQGNTLYTASSDPNHPPFDYKYVFDPKATPGKKVKILGISPVSENYVRLLATDEEEAYYAAETNPYTYVPPSAFEPPLPAITTLDITDTLIVVGAGYATRIALAWDVTGTYADATIRVARNGEPLSVLGRTFERRFAFEGPSAGALDIELIVRGPSGRYQSAGRRLVQYLIEGKARPPEDVTGFSVSQNGNVVTLRWDQVGDVDLAGYEIGYGPRLTATWANRTPLTIKTRGTRVTTAAVPPGDWKFMIKAYDNSTPVNESVTEASFDLVVANELDVISQRQQAPDWLGTRTNFYRHWTGVLVPESTMLASAMTDAQLWDAFVHSPYATCTYEAPEVDIGFDDTARIWGSIDSALGPGVTAGLADPDLEVDYRLAAGSYDGFEPWTIGDRIGRYFKHRLVLNTAEGVAKIIGFLPTVDNIEFIQSAQVVVAAGGATITFPQPFHVVPQVTATAVGTTALYPVLDGITATSFFVRVFDAAGTNVGGTIIYQAKGV